MTGQSALSPAKRKLLEQRLKRKTASPRRSHADLPNRPEAAPRLASLGQARIWLQHQLDPASPANNITSSFFIRSGLDPNILEQSLSQVVSRHEVLHSVYHLRDGEVSMSPLKDYDFRLARQSCSSHSEAVAAAQRHSRESFDLESGLPLRAGLFSSPDGPSLLILVVHDIAFDKWSLKLFWKEVSQVYGDLRCGKSPDLPSLSIQYSDFSYWQRKQLEDGAFDAQADFWRQELAHPPRPIPLPTDLPYPDRITEEGMLARGRLPADTVRRLKAFAAESDASLSMVLQLAFLILLHRYTGEDDLLTCFPVANRSRPETGNLIGFLLNTIVLRADFSQNPTAREALTELKAKSLAALQNQDLPLDRVVEEVKPERIPGRHPLVQTMFVFQREDEGQPKLYLQDCDIEPTYVETLSSKFDLTLFVAESGNAMETVAEFRTDLFRKPTIDRLLLHFQSVVEKMIGEPELPCSEIDYLTEAERKRIAKLSTGPATDFSASPSLLVQIQSHAASRPDSIAANDSRENLSYRQLAAKSDKVAAALLDAGVTPGSPVALLLDKSADAIVAILGILKSGAAYLPIDPNYPEERQRFMLEDAGVEHVISSSEPRSKPAKIPVQTHLIGDLVSRRPSHEHPSTLSPKDGDTAYIIYTSGSTGQPKGTIVTHGSLRHSTEARKRYYPDPPSPFILVPSLSFDSSVAGLFWTLATGGTLILPSFEEQMDPRALAIAIKRHQVRGLLCVPTLYLQLLRHADPCLKSLQTAIVAGEEMPPSLAKRHYALLPDCPLYNEYGPTEATVWASVCRVEREAPDQARSIGLPITNTRIRVLDRHGFDAPIGFPGEIHIAGPGLSKGYVGRPKDTAKSFIILADGNRYYRTGDFGRWTANGFLEFDGRRDTQIKLHGYRIEVGEIERRLAEHPHVVQAAVVPSYAQSDDELSVDEMEEILQEMDSESADQLLREIERLDEATHGDHAVRRQAFTLELKTPTPGFISPPRKAQRDWLIGQAMAEAADNLEHLHRIAPKFVAGKRHDLGADLSDKQKETMSRDEIMEDWQDPLMKAMARYVTESHGDVLEVGFGRGVSAEYIQQFGVRSHTVVEMNDQCVKAYFHPWRAKHAESDIHLHHARWQDVEAELGLFDGIFFHTFPMNEEEFVEYVLNSVTFAQHAFGPMASHLKPGGCLTYLTTEIDSLSRRHQRLLFQHFSEIAFHRVALQIPANTIDTWWADSMVVIKAIK